jgi:hypothetical protein
VASASESDAEAETDRSSTPDLDGSELDDRSQDDEEMDVDIDFGDGARLSDPSEDVGLSPPVSSMDEDITVASSTHLSSEPPTRSSSPANNPPDHSSPTEPQAEPPSTATAYQRPTRTVRRRVLADQGMIDSIEGCSAKHCEEPDGPGNMVSCSAVGCGLNVSHLFSCSSFGCRLAMVDFDYAVSLDVCRGCTCYREGLVLRQRL